MKNFVYAVFFSVAATLSVHAQNSEWHHFPAYEYADIFKMEYGHYSNRLAEWDGSLWIAGSNGMLRYDKESGRIDLCNAELGIPDDASIISLAVGDDCLWFGTYEYGAYLYKNNNGTMRLTQLLNYPSGGIYLDFCYAIVVNGDDCFFGSNDLYAKSYLYKDGVSYFWETHQFCLVSAPIRWIVTDMAFDSSGNLWITFYTDDYIPGSVLPPPYLVKLESGSKYNPVLDIGKGGEPVMATSLAIDMDDNIWFVRDGEIHCYNQASATDTRYWSGNCVDIPDSFYTACEIDKDGNVWFTSSDVLLKYDGVDFKSYVSPEYKNACSILCDGGTVWIYGSDDILYRFENEELVESVRLEPYMAGTELRETGDKQQVCVTVNDGVLSVVSDEAVFKGIEVCGMDGRMLVSRDYAGGATDSRIDLGGLAEACGGVVVVRVSGGGWWCVRKVLLH